jgi:hypothetical protein
MQPQAPLDADAVPEQKHKAKGGNVATLAANSAPATATASAEEIKPPGSPIVPPKTAAVAIPWYCTAYCVVGGIAPELIVHAVRAASPHPSAEIAALERAGKLRHLGNCATNQPLVELLDQLHGHTPAAAVALPSRRKLIDDEAPFFSEEAR